MGADACVNPFDHHGQDGEIRNPNFETRNKFEYQMFEIQNRLEHLNLCFLKIVSDFEFRFSNFSRYEVFLSFFYHGEFLCHIFE
jgi:hypothetical protein